jgi:hypothetical protein
MTDASIFDIIYQVVTFIDAFFSIGITLVGVYLYYKNRNKIKSFFKLLTNYSLQKTISEINEKLNKLNTFSANDTDSKVKHEIQCILHEIDGQIEGNEILKGKFTNEQAKVQKYIMNPEKLTEPLKRGLVSVLREKLNTINLETYNNFASGDNE